MRGMKGEGGGVVWRGCGTHPLHGEADAVAQQAALQRNHGAHAAADAAKHAHEARDGRGPHHRRALHDGHHLQVRHQDLQAGRQARKVSVDVSVDDMI